jgi:UDP-N-acetylglucosamine--N-acetylmuramyl-(pentapeptide) pyrophosphoryl-undecaprenol N-acetylglucosamine transferase
MTEESSDRPILIMAGGTGGHVFPALAVAQELRQRGIPVVWMGTRSGLEAEVVPAAGFPVEWITVSGLRGKGITKLLMAPFMLLIAGFQALNILLRQKPKAVLGMGGFVTGPGGVMATLLRKPLCIHEQNAVAGTTNRLLAWLATSVMEAFPDSFPRGSKVKRKTTLTGNPVRKEITDIAEPEARFSAQQEERPMRLLVLGGSLGAQAINKVVPEALKLLVPEKRPVVRHQAGSRNLEDAKSYYQGVEADVELVPFIEDMADAYTWADIVICRAGALTIAELTASGVASVLVPYPYAIDDHQTLNARYLVDAGAGVILDQKEMTAERVSELLNDFSDHRNRLVELACAARKLARPEATRKIAEICMEAAGISLTGVQPA